MATVHIHSHGADQWVEIDGVRVSGVTAAARRVRVRELAEVVLTIAASDLTLDAAGGVSLQYVDPISGETFTRVTTEDESPPYDVST